MLGRRRTVIITSITGILFSVASIALSFVLRTYLIKNIGIEYVGLYTFLSEIFGLLTALDGGACSSLFIKIHKPIAEKNTYEIKSIFRLIRIVYFIRAFVVFTIGGLLFFLLPTLTSDLEIPLTYIKIAYSIYLILNVASYLFIYYEFLLEAYQKRFITNLVTFLVSVVSTLVNIICLFLLKNFLLYVFIMAATPVLIYIICDFITRIIHRELFNKDIGHRKIKKNEIKDMFKITYYTISGVVVKNTDNILITRFFGFAINGIYSTYKMLNTQITNLINKIKYAAQDSSRNYLVTNNENNSMELIHELTFFYFWICGFCSICLAVLSTPFIAIWLGDEYTMSIIPISLSSFSFFLETLIFPMDDAFYTAESYKRNRSIPLIEVLINLIVSFVLGIFMGIVGVLIGTISFLIYKTIARSYYLIKKTYRQDVKKYYLKVFAYSLVTIFAFIITYFVCSLFYINGIVGLLIDLTFCIIIPNFIFFLFFHKTNEYKFFVFLAKDILFRKKVK